MPNSFNRGGAAEVGLSWTGQNGYFGGSDAYDKTHYGIPLVEEGADEPRSAPADRSTCAANAGTSVGVVRLGAVIVGVRSYRHDELDGEEIATSFKNDTAEFELLAHHRSGRPLEGLDRRLVPRLATSTAGARKRSRRRWIRRRSPRSSTRRWRRRRTSRCSSAAASSTPRFTPRRTSRRATSTTFSGSVGLLVHPTDATTVAFSLARAARNPALEELYFHGPHAGNYAVRERRRGSRMRSTRSASTCRSAGAGSRASGEVTYFLQQDQQLHLPPADRRRRGRLPVTFFTAGDDRLQGIESHLDVAAQRICGSRAASTT